MYAYTFAAPNTTVASSANAAKYDCIFNIINSDDFIPYFPLSQWGFTRYGKTASVSVEDTCKSEWEEMMKNGDEEIEYMKMANPQAPLNELYEIAPTRWRCYFIPSMGASGRVNASSSDNYPENTIGYYRIDEDGLYQSPMFLMKYFAAVATDENDPSHRSGLSFISLDVAPYLEEIKGTLLSQITGINDNTFDSWQFNNIRIACPHYPESYYLLATIIALYSNFS